MSSNIEIQKVCEFCGKDFIARTTVTRYCSNRCSGLAHIRIPRVEDGTCQKAVPTTNAILAELRKVFVDAVPQKRVPDETRAQALEIIEAFDRNGFVDYISLSSSVLFSGNYAVNLDDLKKCTFYNRLRQSDFPTAGNYLGGLEIRKADYKEIFTEFKDNPKAFFIYECPQAYLKTHPTGCRTTNYDIGLRCG